MVDSSFVRERAPEPTPRNDPIEELAQRLGAHSVSVVRLITRMLRVLELDQAPRHWVEGRHGWRVVAGPVDDWMLARHLLGQVTLRAEAPKRTRLIKLDIDSPDDDHYTRDLLDTVVRGNLAAALGKLGRPTCAVVRSSPSRGVHAYVPLREPIGAAELQARVVATVGNRPGVVEVFCQRHLRVPFGRGSTLLDPETLRPMHGRDWGRGVRRNLWQEITDFLDRLEEGRQPLASITLQEAPTAPLPLSSLPYEIPRKKSGSCGELLYGKEYHARIAQLEQGIPNFGERNDAAVKLPFECWRRGMSRSQTQGRVRTLLERGEHVSKDLDRDREGTIIAMVDSAGSEWDRLERIDRAGGCHLYKGGTTLGMMLAEFRAGHPGQSPRAIDGTSSRWRQAAMGLLAESDWERTQPLDPWLRPRLRVLVGVLRWAEEQGWDTSSVAFQSSTLLTIAGGKPAPVSARSGLTAVLKAKAGGGAFRAAGLSPGLVLVQQAVRLGFLSRTAGYRVGETSFRYTTKPPLPLSPLPYEIPVVVTGGYVDRTQGIASSVRNTPKDPQSTATQPVLGVDCQAGVDTSPEGPIPCSTPPGKLPVVLAPTGAKRPTRTPAEARPRSSREAWRVARQRQGDLDDEIAYLKALRRSDEWDASPEGLEWWRHRAEFQAERDAETVAFRNRPRQPQSPMHDIGFTRGLRRT